MAADLNSVATLAVSKVGTTVTFTHEDDYVHATPSPNTGTDTNVPQKLAKLFADTLQQNPADLHSTLMTNKIIRPVSIHIISLHYSDVENYSMQMIDNHH